MRSSEVEMQSGHSPDGKSPGALDRRIWMWILIATAVVGLGLVWALLRFTAAPEYDWTQPADDLIGEFDETVSAPAPATTAMLNQLQDLAPGIEAGAAANVGGPDGDDGTSAFVLQGTRNSLNSVMIQLAEAMGAGRSNDEWGAAGFSTDSGPPLVFVKDDFTYRGFRVDLVGTKAADGELFQQWLLLRPDDERLILVRELGGQRADAEAALDEILAEGGR